MNQNTIERADPFAASAPVKTSMPRSSSASGVEEVKQVAREQAHDTAAEIKEGATQALQSAKTAGTDFIADQKTRLADLLDEYTQAVKAACGSLEDTEHRSLVSPGHRASAKLESASTYLRDTQPADMLHDLGDFAKRKPEIVFGAMFVAGLATVRFLKASSRHQNSSRREDRYHHLADTRPSAPRTEPFTMPEPPQSGYPSNNPPVIP